VTIDAMAGRRWLTRYEADREKKPAGMKLVDYAPFTELDRWCLSAGTKTGW